MEVLIHMYLNVTNLVNIVEGRDLICVADLLPRNTAVTVENVRSSRSRRCFSDN